jgi:hypothetical protein
MRVPFLYLLECKEISFIKMEQKENVRFVWLKLFQEAANSINTRRIVNTSRFK